MAKVLFAPVNSREIAQFALIQPELGGLGAEVVTVARNGNMEALLQRAGFRFKRLGDYKTMNMVDVIDQEKPDLVHANFLGGFPNIDALAVAARHRGIPCLQIFGGVAFDPRERMKNVSFFRGSLLILMKRVFRTVTQGASLRQVLCFLRTLWASSSPMQFLKALPGEMLRLAFPARRALAYRSGVLMGVPGQYAKDVFIAMGYPPESVFIVGQPRLDPILNRSFDNQSVLSKLDVIADRSVAVLATSPLYLFWSREDRKTFLRTVVRAIEHFPEEQLVIKLHPDERIEDYQRMLRESGCDNVTLVRDVDLYELLHACNLLMTTHSTVAVEAMLFGKPVICIDLTGRVAISHYTRDGAAIGVQREEDLLPAIRKALYDPQTREGMEQARKRFLSKHIYKPDGQTSRRIAELIIQLAQESKIRTTPSER